jgi:hypothetical protein
MTHRNRKIKNKKIEKIHVLKCWMFYLEGTSGPHPH